MPGYALKLYTPKAFMKKLKQEIPRYMVGCACMQHTWMHPIIRSALSSRRALLCVSRMSNEGHAIQEKRAAKPKPTGASSRQGMQGQGAPPQRLLLSMMSCLFVLKARRDPLMTEVCTCRLLSCCPPALCAAHVCPSNWSCQLVLTAPCLLCVRW
jgi:hypothetical protein